MTLTIVQQNQVGIAASGTTIAVTLSPTTPGNMIVAVIDSRNNTVSSIIDGSNTYVQAGSYYGPLANPNNNTLSIWYAKNSSSASLVTTTFSASAGHYWVSIYEVSGADISAPYVTSSTGNSGLSNPITTGTLSLGGANAIIIAGICEISPPIVAGTGYTLVNFGWTGDSNKQNATEYHVVSADESATATGGGGAWMILAAAFGDGTFNNFGTGVLGFNSIAINASALFETPTGPGVLAFGPLGMGSSAALDEGLPLGRLRQFWTL
jgi:hypothetical protein